MLLVSFLFLHHCFQTPVLLFLPILYNWPSFQHRFIGQRHPESEILSTILDATLACPLSTVKHIPCSVYPLLDKVLSNKLCSVISSIWRLFLFLKAVLCVPPLHRFCHHFILPSVLFDCLHVWPQPDGFSTHWKSLQDDLHVWLLQLQSSISLHYAVHSLTCWQNNDSAFQELLQRHLVSDPLTKICFPSCAVLVCLKDF